MQQQPQQPTEKKVVLNSSDELFDDIRDLNFSAVGIHLSRKAKQISAAFEVSINVFVLFTPSLMGEGRGGAPYGKLYGEALPEK